MIQMISLREIIYCLESLSNTEGNQQETPLTLLSLSL